MEAWWENLSPWDQTSYFVAAFGLVYLLRYVPLEWLARIPPGSAAVEDREGIEVADVWPLINDDGASAGHSHDGGGLSGEAGGGHDGHGSE